MCLVKCDPRGSFEFGGNRMKRTHGNMENGPESMGLTEIRRTRDVTAPLCLVRPFLCDFGCVCPFSVNSNVAGYQIFMADGKFHDAFSRLLIPIGGNISQNDDADNK